jgi:amidohydrolase
MTNILSAAQELAPQLIEWRRTIHHHPELGFQEHRTADYAAGVLRALGGRVRTGVGKTGVVADFGQGDPIIAIRADMDALPILEANPAPYASGVPGVMHACGHDSHTAMAMGAASLLARHGFPGTLRILIQPSEEANDEESLSGAPRMIQDGAMEGVRNVIALHVDPSEPAGTISIDSGPASGGVDSFFAAVTGRGGHGASPHKTVDPVYLTAHVLLALHGIVSRRLDPFAPAVVTVGSIHGGQAENVIPEEVELAGTIRFMNKDVRRKIHTEVERALSISRTLGGDYRLKIDPGTPPMINDERVTQVIRQAAIDLLGQQGVTAAAEGLGAEDFGCFSEVAPGAMFSLGCRIEGDERIVHHPRFDIDERCLPVGAALLAESALRLMSQD